MSDEIGGQMVDGPPPRHILALIVDKSQCSDQVLPTYHSDFQIGSGRGIGGQSTRPPNNGPITPEMLAYEAWLKSLTKDEVLSHARWLSAQLKAQGII